MKSLADVQMHACAAGYFSCVTTQQLFASDVNEQYILFAMGSSHDATTLSIRMQSLQQVYAACTLITQCSHVRGMPSLKLTKRCICGEAACAQRDHLPRRRSARIWPCQSVRHSQSQPDISPQG